MGDQYGLRPNGRSRADPAPGPPASPTPGHAGTPSRSRGERGAGLRAKWRARSHRAETERSTWRVGASADASRRSPCAASSPDDTQSLAARPLQGVAECRGWRKWSTTALRSFLAALGRCRGARYWTALATTGHKRAWQEVCEPGLLCLQARPVCATTGVDEAVTPTPTMLLHTAMIFSKAHRRRPLSGRSGRLLAGGGGRLRRTGIRLRRSRRRRASDLLIV